LRDVPDDIFNLSRDALIAQVTGLALDPNHAIERQKYALFQILLVRLLQQILLLVLSSQRVRVFSAVKIAEEVVSILLVVFLPAVVDSQLEENCSLLAHVAFVCLVQLRICQLKKSTYLTVSCNLQNGLDGSLLLGKRKAEEVLGISARIVVMVHTC
jgi:PIN domain nuclease of toxin-antitoxin system